MLTRRLALAAPALLAATPARAQAWPDRPVRLIVTIPPGGAPDLAARILAEALSPKLGQPVVVENRAGSNGNIAAELVARGRPDGHTLLFAPDSLITINPHLYERMPVDVQRELVPVATTASNQFVLSVHPSVPARTLPEFIAWAKSRNPPAPYASGGIGSQHQMAMEMLMRRADFEMLHVPFRGGTPAANATMSGDTLAMFSGTSSAPFIREGRLRALAVTGTRRAAQLPELPTIAEFFPGYELTIWLGLFAPPGTPEPVIERLRRDIEAALADPALRARYEAAGGLEPLVTTREAFAALIRTDSERYGRIIREAGIKAE
jgi:tripartite-type tricarboxylate transporter receptor subunit TctC